MTVKTQQIMITTSELDVSTPKSHHQAL